MVGIEKYRKEIERLRGQQQTLLDMKDELNGTVKELEQSIIDIEEGQLLVQDVALKTQATLKMSIEPIVTSALDIVFQDDAYGFSVEFDIKRNKTECVLAFTRNGHKISPIDSSGFGAIDVAAFALRLALWNVSKPRTRPTFILDEPFKHVSEDLQEAVTQMVHTLAHKLGIQVIMVTHNKASDVLEYSDKVFRVRKDKGGISRVTVVKGEEE